jgi:hypothetical protein
VHANKRSNLMLWPLLFRNRFRQSRQNPTLWKDPPIKSAQGD